MNSDSPFNPKTFRLNQVIIIESLKEQAFLSPNFHSHHEYILIDHTIDFPYLAKTQYDEELSQILPSN